MPHTTYDAWCIHDNKTIRGWTGKGKVHNGLYDARVRCSSSFPWSWASRGLAHGVTDSRPHHFHNLLLSELISQRYTPVPIYTAWRQRHVCEQLAQGHYTNSSVHGIWLTTTELQIKCPTARISSHVPNILPGIYYNYYYGTTTVLRPLPGLYPGLPGWATTRKVKTIWIYWRKRYWMAVASAGPYANLHLAPDRITMPASHHSVFRGRIPFQPSNQQHQKHEGWSIEGCLPGIYPVENPT